MTQHCKNTCIKHRAKKQKLGYYPTGHKRCLICCIFLKWDGLYCPCCGAKLSQTPKNKKMLSKVEVFRY